MRYVENEDTNVKAEMNDGGVRMERIPYGKYTKNSGKWIYALADQINEL